MSPKDRMRKLTQSLQPSGKLCACPSADGQAAQLLAGMLAGALTHRQNMRVTPRERDVTHLVDLVQSQLCKGQPDRALQLLGMVQYVHVSGPADDWLEEVVFDGLDHDIFGEPADLLATLSHPHNASPCVQCLPAFLIQLAPSIQLPPPPIQLFSHNNPPPFPSNALTPPPLIRCPPSSSLFPPSPLIQCPFPLPLPWDLPAPC